MKMHLVILSSAALLAPASIALAVPPASAPHSPQNSASPATHDPVAAGQPNASCEDTPNTPGNASSAPGSAFNPDGVAGTRYAGEQPQNSRNPASVSQYDVACQNQPH